MKLWRSIRSRPIQVSIFALLAAMMVIHLPASTALAAGAYTVADSMNDFSGVQGQEGWYYGYYPCGQSNCTITPSLAAGFAQLANFVPNGTVYGDTWYETANPSEYWTALWAAGGHDESINTGSGRTSVYQWAVRRWISTVDGTVTISGEHGSSAACFADGTTGHILVTGADGVTREIWSHDTRNGEVSYSVSTTLHRGDMVDFAIDPNVTDTCDSTTFTATITALDTTAPTTTATPSGPTKNSSGWYTGSVAVALSATDPDDAVSQIAYTLDGVSGTISGASGTVNIAGDGVHTLTYAATDSHSNTETTKYLTVRIDTTPPAVTYTGPLSYTIDQTVDIICSATDALSGVASSTCQTISGPAISFGSSNTYSATAVDVAGNVGSGSVTFTVRATFDSLCTMVQRFTTKSSAANSLCAKLSNAAAAGQRGDTNAEDNVVNAFINELNAQSGKAFSAAQVALLTTWVRRLL